MSATTGTILSHWHLEDVKLVLRIYAIWLIHSAVVNKGLSYVGLENSDDLSQFMGGNKIFIKMASVKISMF